MILIFIYCDDCVDCENMERIILDAVQIEYEFKKINCETDEAIDIALNYDVTDVPACVFLNDDKTLYKSYSGPRSCQKEDVEWAIKYIGD